MATKFKSKYTAQQIEQILDNISAASQGSFIKVDELPDINEAATNQFYLLDNQMWYVNTDVVPHEWEKLASGGSGQEGLDTSEWPSNQINMFDFVEDESDESYFFIKNDTKTWECLDSIKTIINEKEGSYYVILGITGQGWLETSTNTNEIINTSSSYDIIDDKINFFVLLTLIDGTQVKIVLDDNETGRYLINYIGYAL